MKKLEHLFSRDESIVLKIWNYARPSSQAIMLACLQAIPKLANFNANLNNLQNLFLKIAEILAD